MEIKQNEAFKLAYRFITETNQNVFLTGKAGTGKTTFLKYLKQHSVKNIVVAAPTGVAAINAGGVTLHSLFQLPFAPYIPGSSSDQNTVDSHNLLSQIRLRKNKLKLLRSLELLVIDEVSMVPSHTVDAIDTILRSVRRRRDLPFGGVQVLFIGDLHQLPPVVKRNEWNILKAFYPSIFFFDSIVLRENIPVMIELTEIYRQQDNQFIRILNGIRNNNLSKEDFDKLNSRQDPALAEKELDKDGYITLTTHNAQADNINRAKLNRLKSPSFTYDAHLRGDFPEHAFPADGELELKVGAQVMFLKNDVEERRYFNGKIGVVESLDEESIVVKCEDDPEPIEVRKDVWRNVKYSLEKDTREIQEEELGSFEQYPLRLAWAITIHKSQGLTFDKLVIDAEKAFAKGQVYVALSRCTSLEGLVLSSPVNRQFLGAHQNLKSWQEKNNKQEELPQRFEQARQTYIKQELYSIFTWDKWFYELQNLKKAIQENWEKLPQDSEPWVNEMIKQRDEMAKVAEKFRRRIDLLLQQNPRIEENKHLQQRIEDAANYFSDKMEAWLKQFSDHPLSVDTKKVARKLDQPIEEINFYVLGILRSINYCKNGFKLDEYLKPAKQENEVKQIASAYGKTDTKKLSKEDNQHGELYYRLSELRKDLGDEKDLPLYRIFNNQAILNVCANLPGSTEALLNTKGFGKVKVGQYGEEVLEIVKEYCEENGLETQVEMEVPKKKKKKTKGETLKKTLALFKEGKNAEQIAAERGLVTGTIESHLAQAIALGEIDIREVMKEEEAKKLAALFPKNREDKSLGEIKNEAGDGVSFGQLRMVANWLEREREVEHEQANQE